MRRITHMLGTSLMLAAMCAATSSSGHAGDADIVDVSITALGDSRFRIDATVEHADTGWDHYANRWDVLTESGELLGTRELLHPHVNEQPFTRSLTLNIPADVARVVIRAGDSVHGVDGGASIAVDVPH